MLPFQALGVEGQVLLDALLRQNGGTGRHAAQNGDAVGGRLTLLGYLVGEGSAGQGQGAGLALGLLQHTGLLQALDVEMDGGGRLQAHGGADLAHRGGISVLGSKLHDIVINLLLFGGKLGHNKAPFSVGQLERVSVFSALYHTSIRKSNERS